MFLHTYTKFLYAFFGIVFLVIGIAVVSFKTGLLPQFTIDAILHNTDNNASDLHLLQEFGSMLLFAGFISFWAIRNYENSMSFHWGMTIFWASLALIHWFDVRGLRGPVGPIINTIPFTLFLITGLLRKKAQGAQSVPSGL